MKNSLLDSFPLKCFRIKFIAKVLELPGLPVIIRGI